ncbi:hypothetical protein BG005_009793 [Podila minutissima]|nr:hypothetical protein BG005_009793 [Podila minutissima]
MTYHAIRKLHVLYFITLLAMISIAHTQCSEPQCRRPTSVPPPSTNYGGRQQPSGLSQQGQYLSTQHVEAITANQVYQRQIQTVLDGLFMRNAATRFQIPTPLSPKFKGDDSETPFAEFWSKLKIVAERFPDALHSDQERINYAIQSMEGAPARFFGPFISSTADDLEGFLSSYSTVISILNDMYGDQQLCIQELHLHTKLECGHSVYLGCHTCEDSSHFPANAMSKHEA